MTQGHSIKKLKAQIASQYLSTQLEKINILEAEDFKKLDRLEEICVELADSTVEAMWELDDEVYQNKKLKVKITGSDR